MMKFWICENHICELQSEELNKGWSSQLYTQLLQLQACTRFEPLTSAIQTNLLALYIIGRALHRYAEVKGLNPVQAWILFRLSFCNCKSCVYNCDDHPSFKNRIMRPKKNRQEKKKITTGHPPVPDHLNRINLSWDIRKGFCKDLQEKYCELLS